PGKHSERKLESLLQRLATRSRFFLEGSCSPATVFADRTLLRCPRWKSFALIPRIVAAAAASFRKYRTVEDQRGLGALRRPIGLGGAPRAPAGQSRHTLCALPCRRAANRKRRSPRSPKRWQRALLFQSSARVRAKTHRASSSPLPQALER